MTNKNKPGWKTTEFWMSILSQGTAIVGALKGIVPTETAAHIIIVLNSVYAIMRTLHKKPAITSIVNK